MLRFQFIVSDLCYRITLFLSWYSIKRQRSLNVDWVLWWICKELALVLIDIVPCAQVIAVNGTFPGPVINATTNYNVDVNVFNRLDEPLLLTWWSSFSLLLWFSASCDYLHCVVLFETFCYLGMVFRPKGTHGKTVFLAQTVPSLPTGTSLTTFKWKTKSEVFSISPHLTFRELLVVLDRSLSTTGIVFLSRSISLMEKSALWLVIGILRTIQ